MQQLFNFCGQQWTSVPALVRFFVLVVSTVADPRNTTHPLSAAHFRQTFALFQSVRKLYPDGSAWYELPPLAHACTVLFEASIARSHVAEAHTLRPMWSEFKMQQGKMTTMKLLTLTERGWLVTNVVPLRGRHALPAVTVSSGSRSASASKPSRRIAADKADSLERSAMVVRDLLVLSPSAFHLVMAELLVVRDDIFSQYLGRTRAELFGIFDVAVTVDASSNALQPSFNSAQAAEVYYVPITSKDMSLLDSRAMQTVTRLCLSRAMDQSLSATNRSAAVTQFVESPATSHAEVIELLKNLQARVAFKIDSERAAEKEDKKQEGATSMSLAESSSDVIVDDAAELLIEAMILRVFSTDSAWFILAHLLSPDVIASSPQRTTGAILTNLRLWAPIDRTVAVLRILLEPRRRRAITLFLHKQILRLLFECMDANEQARLLWKTEWSQRNDAATRMAPDVLHEVIKMCVTALNGSSSGKSALAWSVVEELVADCATREIDPATLMLLFVTWQPASPALDSTGQLAANAVFLSTLIRSVQPARKRLAGMEDPASFGHFHSQLVAEPQVILGGQHESAASIQVCSRFSSLMNKLSAVTKHSYLRLLSRLQQFVFSASMAGVPDDCALQAIERLLLEVSVASEPSAASFAQYVDVELDSVSQFSLQILPRLFAGLSLQVLTRAWIEKSKSDPQYSFQRFSKDHHTPFVCATPLVHC